MTAADRALIARLAERGTEIATLCDIIADTLRGSPATDAQGWAVSGVGTLATVLSNDLVQLAEA